MITSMTTYTIKDTSMLLDVSPKNERKYMLKIRDLPSEDKPREKLLTHGPHPLSIQELVAVLLGTGTKKEGVLEMSNRIFKEYGQKLLIHHKDPKSLARDLDIPLVKALQIVAAGELGRRYFSRNGNGPAVIRTPKDVYNYLRDMRSISKEHLRGIYLNSHHMVIYDEVVSIGTVDANLIHAREVFKPAIEYGAVAIVLAHNHPSGVVKPSLADIKVTEQLVGAGKILGIHILDHVIITKDSFASVNVNYE